jgi:hypothetical protein
MWRSRCRMKQKIDTRMAICYAARLYANSGEIRNQTRMRLRGPNGFHLKSCQWMKLIGNVDLVPGK